MASSRAANYPAALIEAQKLEAYLTGIEEHTLAEEPVLLCCRRLA
jgi:hypothetical protein